MKEKTMKVFIHAKYLCDRRKLDANKIHKYLTLNDYKIIKNPKKADIIILVTCGADNTVADVYFGIIEEYKKYKAELIVAGCISETDHERFQKSYDGEYICTKEIEKIDDYFPRRKINFSQLEDFNRPLVHIDLSKIRDTFRELFTMSSFTRKNYVKFFNYILKNLFGNNYILLGNLMNLPLDDYCVIRISWGCLNNCSYCSIKNAVGKFHSKPIEDCIKEFKGMVKKGYTNFYLTADDTGAYGIDIEKTFPNLLNKLIKIEGNYKIGIYALNPIWLVKYIDELETIIESKKIIGIHIPIQSGCNHILKLMNRYSDVEKIKEAFIRLKKANPNIDLYTHIIVGFPSETEGEFQQTLSFIKDLKLSGGSFIRMSIKKGTPVEGIEPKIPKDEINKRKTHGKKYVKRLGYSVFENGGYFGRKNK